MAFLDNLPNELFGQIFSHLNCQDLVLACQVSRRFNTLAEPYLYRVTSVQTSRVYLLLRTLLSRPMLGNHVRHLNFMRLGGFASFPTAQPDVALLTAGAERFGIKQPTGSEAAELLLLLHLLPSLDILYNSLGYDPNMLAGFLGDQDFHSDALPVGLQSLRELHCDYEFNVSRKNLRKIMQLPLLRVLRVTMEDDTGVEGVEIDKWTGSSAVTDLAITSSYVTTRQLKTILMIPQAAVRFSFSAHRALAFGDFDASRIWRALGLHRQTLQYVQLQIDDNEYENFDDDVYESFDDGVVEHTAISSLRHWPVLRTIDCSISRLLGYGREKAVMRLVDLLPMSIRELVLDGDEFWMEGEVIDELVHLMEMKEVAGLDYLRVVEVPEGMGQDIRLREAFEAVGVELKTFP
ncbi:hypothetical protein Q9L58_006246 [Maublancomyces gigas]|uniref:F-box domain-containing protein n=1 Tax=Discina gigas TaxID=1032678 RepID=A0ABR3GFU1_9PEZI